MNSELRYHESSRAGGGTCREIRVDRSGTGRIPGRKHQGEFFRLMNLASTLVSGVHIPPVNSVEPFLTHLAILSQLSVFSSMRESSFNARKQNHQ